jgi:hypothetical protein
MLIFRKVERPATRRATRRGGNSADLASIEALAKARLEAIKQGVRSRVPDDSTSTEARSESGSES